MKVLEPAKDRLLTVREVCHLTGLTHGRVCQLLRSGQMKGTKIGRLMWLIPENEAKKFVDPTPVGRPRRGESAEAAK